MKRELVAVIASRVYKRLLKDFEHEAKANVLSAEESSLYAKLQQAKKIEEELENSLEKLQTEIAEIKTKLEDTYNVSVSSIRSLVCRILSRRSYTQVM